MRPLMNLTLLLLALPLLAQTTAPSSQPAATQPDAPKLVNNPLFPAWANYPLNTSITYDIASLDENPPTSITMTLIDKKPDSLTLLSTHTLGSDYRQLTTVPRQIPAGDEPFFLTSAWYRAKLDLVQSDTTREQLTLEGKPVDTTCYIATLTVLSPIKDAPPRPALLKLWIAPSLPGGFVKQEFTYLPTNTTPLETHTITTTTRHVPTTTTVPATQP